MGKLPELTPLKASAGKKIGGSNFGRFRTLSARMDNELAVFALDSGAAIRAKKSESWTGQIWNGNYAITKDSRVLSLAGYTSVTGDLVVESNYVTNLDRLESLTHIGGDLIIRGTLLQDLDGLANLHTVGGNLKIEGNVALRLLGSCGGFIRSVEDMVVGRRFWTLREARAGDFGGLSNLSSVGGDFYIGDNGSLQSLRGLENVRTVSGSLSIWVNDALEDLSGLGNLRTIGGHLEIWGNPLLSDLFGLGTLTSIGGDFSLGMGDFGNDALTDLDDLSALKSVGGDLSIRSNGALENIDGLSGVSNVAGNLHFINNGNLSDLDGLSNLSRFEGPSVQISNNDNLSQNDILEFQRRLVSKGFKGETYLAFNK